VSQIIVVRISYAPGAAGALFRRSLRRIANDLPVRQGRHNGKHAVQLRDATDAELCEATALTERLIRAYAEYLDRRHDGE